MDQCIVCLETNTNTFSRISTASSEWIENKMRKIIEKHLWWWYLETSSYNNGLARWICCECWQEISSFNRFYVKIERVHRNFHKIMPLSNPGTKRQEEETIVKLEESNSELKLPEERQREENVEGLAECVDNFEEEIISIVEIKNELCVSSNPLIINDESANANLHIQQIDDNDNAINEMQTDEDEWLITKHRKNRSKRKVYTGRKKKQVQKKRNTKSIKLKENLACETVPFNEIQSEEDEPLVKKSNIIKSQKKSKRNVHAGRNNKELTKKTNTKKAKLTNNSASESVAFNNFFLEYKLECCICNVPLPDFRSLKLHYRNEHKTRGYARCCGKKFFIRWLLVDHLKVHAVSNFFKCHLCTKTYTTSRSLDLHLETHKNRERTFTCDQCGKSFFKLYILKRHKMTHVPESEKQYNCSQCEKKFACKYKRRRHEDTVHSKKLAKTCNICGKTYYTNTYLLRHMEEHGGLHIAMETCNICGFITPNKDKLSRHMRIHYQEENPKEQICPHCSKVSPNIKAHRRHIKYTHNTERKHFCNICNKAFIYPSRLKEHLSTTHTGEALYTCPHCPRTFNTASSKHKHRKVFHRKEYELSQKNKLKQGARKTISEDVGKKTENAQKTSRDLVLSTESGTKVYTLHF